MSNGEPTALPAPDLPAEHALGYVKFSMSWRIWLVPMHEVSPAFREALKKLRRVECGDLVDWTEAEEAEFLRIFQLSDLIIL
jgi:hypothetical protein